MIYKCFTLSFFFSFCFFSSYNSDSYTFGHVVEFNAFVMRNNAELRNEKEQLEADNKRKTQENDRMKLLEENRKLCNSMRDFWSMKYIADFKKCFPQPNELQMSDPKLIADGVLSCYFLYYCAYKDKLDGVPLEVGAGNDVLEYFIHNTRIGYGNEIYDGTKMLQCNIGVLTTWGADFGGNENIRNIMSYVFDLYLNRIFCDDEFVKSVVDKASKNNGWVRKFLGSEYGASYDEEQVKSLVFGEFIPAIKNYKNKYGRFLFYDRRFGKIKLPCKSDVDRKKRILSFSSYEDTLELFAKKLIYLTCSRNIVSEVIDLEDSGKYIPRYFNANLDDFFNRYNSEVKN